MTRRLLRATALTFLVSLAACGGSDDPVVPDGASVALDGGDTQTLTVGTAAATPLSVVVKDANGAALVNIPVRWSVTSGGGSVTPTTSFTDASGVAATAYQAGGSAGPKVIAAIVSGAVGSPLSFSLVAAPAAARRLVKTSGDVQTSSTGSAFPSPLVVTAVDSFGNGVSGVPVLFAVTTGGGTISPSTVPTDAQGKASALYSAAAIGTGTVTATAAGLVGSPVIFSETASGAIQLVKTLPVPANYGLHDQFIRAGLAFLNTWNDGLNIYDVGDGRAGGTPANPIFLGKIVTNSNGVPGGAQVHNSWWYWAPNGDKKYVFVGQEGPASIGSSSSGDIHVVDISNVSQPVEVATFQLAGAGVHNFWVDETNEILYAAYYNGGVVALNISGTLSGDLSARLLANVKPGGAGNTYIWGVQLYNNSLYATDMLSGFWQLRLVSGAFQVLAGGNNVPERLGSDQWVANGFAYSGTWGNRAGHPGNAVKVWQLNGTGAPVLVDSIITSGIGTVSDVEVSADNRMLMFSAENGVSAGLFFYSLVANPAHPTLIASYPVGTGVHTATFSEIGGRRYVFAAKNPSSPALLVLDVTAINP